MATRLSCGFHVEVQWEKISGLTCHTVYSESRFTFKNSVDGLAMANNSRSIEHCHTIYHCSCFFRPENFGPDTMKQHVQVLTELVIRDRNRPSVVMWSLANEPDSSLPEAETYFK